MAAPEPLYSVVWGAQGITLQVESHGCTRPGDFVWQLQPVAAGESAELSKLQLQRKQADAAGASPICRARSLPGVSQAGPAATAIQAGKPFALSNPLLLSARIQP